MTLQCKVDKESKGDRKSTRLNSSHVRISYAVFCLKKKTRAGVRGLDQAAEHLAAELGHDDRGLVRPLAHRSLGARRRGYLALGPGRIELGADQARAIVAEIE